MKWIKGSERERASKQQISFHAVSISCENPKNPFNLKNPSKNPSKKSF